MSRPLQQHKRGNSYTVSFTPKVSRTFIKLHSPYLLIHSSMKIVSNDSNFSHSIDATEN